ncbi:hypothetical protein [Flavobacterium algicola]|uniref:hypothetical protein n=1 Tax=Flavobacterium algicola TaxID=556529 RepID=UPI001EFE2F39|nr:hypothetical protein [Flavobacterium algicola]MCG9791408.1 hypothetical protein [Flavobacterium algicola]
MKNKLGIVSIAFFCCQALFAQIETSKMVKGQVRNQLIPVEDVIVFNTKHSSGATVNAYGSFEIMASVNDTLVFSSLVFKSKKLILTEKDFITPKIIVPLEVFTNELAEVIILAQKEIHPVSGSTQRIVDARFFDDALSSPKNSVMPSDQSIDKGMDFVRIYKGILKTMRKDNPGKQDFYKDTAFSDYVITHVDYNFLSNTLELQDDQIKLFLVYCENDSKSRSLMNPESEFHLIDFLTLKSKEFKKISAAGK